MVYDTSDVNFYSNTNIVPSVDIGQGDEIESQDTLVLHVTFGYDSGVTPSSSINTLTSYINFRFVDSTAPPDVKLVDAINALVSGATPTNGVYTIGSNGASGCSYKLAFDTDNNLRYVGSNPCNYVTFNGETWRIIGVISGMVDGNGNTLQPLIKLISTSKYNNATTTVFNSKTYPTPINYWTNTSLYDTFSALAVTSNTMIQGVKWRVGGARYASTVLGTFYTVEKNFLTSTAANIGLMSVSDYGFTHDNLNTCSSITMSDWAKNRNKTNCIANNKVYHSWLSFAEVDYKLTVTTNVATGYTTGTYIYRIFIPGTTQVTTNGTAYPVVFLKNSVLVDSGNGDANSPYTLK